MEMLPINHSNCAYNDPVSLPRFLLIQLACLLATAGVVLNLLLLRRFGSFEYRNSPAIYLTCLAFLDTFICLCYIMIFGADAAAIYLQLEWLYFLWNYYCIPLLTVARIVQMASTYVIICAAAERWLTMVQDQFKTVAILFDMASATGRYIAIAVVFLASIGFQFIIFLELKVVSYPKCPLPTGKVAVETTDLVNTYSYQVFAYYFIPIVQVFIPFPVMLIFNLLIIAEQKRRFNSKFGSVDGSGMTNNRSFVFQKSFSFYNNVELYTNRTAPLAAFLLALDKISVQVSDRQERRRGQMRIRSATYTLIAIATTYLVCNSLSMLILILERLPGNPFIRTADGGSTHFYIVTTDIISFLFMLVSFLRFFIYLWFNPEIRQDLKTFYCRKRQRSSYMATVVENQYAETDGCGLIDSV